MPSLFDGYMIDAAHAMLDQEFGVSVTLTSGAADTPEFTARRIHRTYPVMDANGFPMQLEFREYLLPVLSCTINGNPHKPKRGDKITETIDGEAVVFKIYPQADLPAVEENIEQGRYRVRADRLHE